VPNPILNDDDRLALAREEERRLSPEEFQARVDAPWTEYERESFRSLVDWFVRRYPTAGERLAAMRRAELRIRGQGVTGSEMARLVRRADLDED
jgi:hypothetical protein